MVFKNLCVLVHWTKVALALEGLNRNTHHICLLLPMSAHFPSLRGSGERLFIPLQVIMFELQYLVFGTFPPPPPSSPSPSQLSAPSSPSPSRLPLPLPALNSPQDCSHVENRSSPTHQHTLFGNFEKNFLL